MANTFLCIVFATAVVTASSFPVDLSVRGRTRVYDKDGFSLDFSDIDATNVSNNIGGVGVSNGNSATSGRNSDGNIGGSSSGTNLVRKGSSTRVYDKDGFSLDFSDLEDTSGRQTSNLGSAASIPRPNSGATAAGSASSGNGLFGAFHSMNIFGNGGLSNGIFTTNFNKSYNVFERNNPSNERPPSQQLDLMGHITSGTRFLGSLVNSFVSTLGHQLQQQRFSPLVAVDTSHGPTIQIPGIFEMNTGSSNTGNSLVSVNNLDGTIFDRITHVHIPGVLSLSSGGNGVDTNSHRTSVLAPFVNVDIRKTVAGSQASVQAPFTNVDTVKSANAAHSSVKAPFTNVDTLRTANNVVASVRAPFTNVDAVRTSDGVLTSVKAPFTAVDVVHTPNAKITSVQAPFTNVDTVRSSGNVDVAVQAPAVSVGVQSAALLT